MAMRWHDVLFLHWPVPAGIIGPMLPSGLELDTFDGSAWIGVVPFRMTGVRLRVFPQFAGMTFAEINVRTYVKAGGKSGVWFFSLDASSWLAVRGARFAFGLPYYDAEISVRLEEETVHYHSFRADKRNGRAEFDASYKPVGSVYRAASGTLDHWLTERYCLYAVDRRGRLCYGDIHHHPWPLQPAEFALRINTMTRPLGIILPETLPLAHFARRLDVVAWRITPLNPMHRED